MFGFSQQSDQIKYVWSEGIYPPHPGRVVLLGPLAFKLNRPEELRAINAMLYPVVLVPVPGPVSMLMSANLETTMYRDAFMKRAHTVRASIVTPYYDPIFPNSHSIIYLR